MADLTQQPKSDIPEPTKLHRYVAAQLALGHDLPAIAMKLAKGHKKAAKRYREKLRRMARTDERLKIAIFEEAHATLGMSLPGAMAAVGRRAQKGRMDAVRFTSEATGFHNPKVRHEHSGDVNINLNIPRPNYDGEREVIDVPEADVVEE